MSQTTAPITIIGEIEHKEAFSQVMISDGVSVNSTYEIAGLGNITTGDANKQDPSIIYGRLTTTKSMFGCQVQTLKDEHMLSYW